jgi:very-short-patch-repair endonuclease
MYGQPERSVRRAKKLRRRETLAEKVLWSFLQNRQVCDAKFRRQFAVGPFIADFCCTERRLIIEVDGSIHNYRRGYDRWRQRHLEALGYVVLRFSNEDVLEDGVGVLREVAHALLSRRVHIPRLPGPHLHPLPEGEDPLHQPHF